MSNPLFSVGEVVILQSIKRPDLNGEYTVKLILKNGYKHPNGKDCVFSEMFGYLLCELTDDLISAQSSLRKKHQPGEQSFAELMQTLKSPVSV